MTTVWLILLFFAIGGAVAWITLAVQRWGILRTHERGYQAEPVDSSDEPIDVVIPWVTTDDPAWLKERNEWALKSGESVLPANRHSDNGELRYALRGVEKNIPWYRNLVLIVHAHEDGTPQVPSWLRTDHPRLRIVTHPEFFASKADLPTFNSSAIECHVHRIGDLSHTFLYSNDDFIPVSPLHRGDFQMPNGVPKVFFSTYTIPRGSREGHQKHTRSLMRQNELLDRVYGEEERTYPRHVMNLRDRDAEYTKREFMTNEWKRTSAIRFRSDTDFIDNGFLHPHWYVKNGRGVAGSMDSVMVLMQSHRRIKPALGTLYASPPKIICFNDDHETESVTKGENIAAMRAYLNHFLGTPSSFEKETSSTSRRATSLHRDTAPTSLESSRT